MADEDDSFTIKHRDSEALVSGIVATPYTLLRDTVVAKVRGSGDEEAKDVAAGLKARVRNLDAKQLEALDVKQSSTRLGREGAYTIEKTTSADQRHELVTLSFTKRGSPPGSRPTFIFTVAHQPSAPPSLEAHNPDMTPRELGQHLSFFEKLLLQKTT
jgi:hypothetical protein